MLFYDASDIICFVSLINVSSMSTITQKSGTGTHRLHKQRKGHGGIGHKLHEPVVADKFWEELAVFLLDKLCIVPFESPVA